MVGNIVTGKNNGGKNNGGKNNGGKNNGGFSENPPNLTFKMTEISILQ